MVNKKYYQQENGKYYMQVSIGQGLFPFRFGMSRDEVRAISKEVYGDSGKPVIIENTREVTLIDGSFSRWDTELGRGMEFYFDREDKLGMVNIVMYNPNFFYDEIIGWFLVTDYMDENDVWDDDEGEAAMLVPDLSKKYGFEVYNSNFERDLEEKFFGEFNKEIIFPGMKNNNLSRMTYKEIENMGKERGFKFIDKLRTGITFNCGLSYIFDGSSMPYPMFLHLADCKTFLA